MAGRFDLVVFVLGGWATRAPKLIAGVRRSAPRSCTAIIAVANTADEALAVATLDAGADDLVDTATPASVLAARARAVLRRLDPMGLFSLAPVLELRERERLLVVHGQAVELSAYECGLLAPLFETPGQVREREELRRFVWGPQARQPQRGQTDLIDVHLSRVRTRKMGPEGWRLQAVTGVGFRLLVG